MRTDRILLRAMGASLLMASLCVKAEKPFEFWETAPKVTLHPTMQYTSSWIGNSLAYPKWVQKDGNGLTVGPDGTCYATSGWDEAGKGIGFYKNGDDVGHCQNISVGGRGIAVDDQYIYACTTVPHKKDEPALFGIARWHLDGTTAPPIPGAPVDRTGMSIVPFSSVQMAGLACRAGKVYVADAASNVIHVVDRETLGGDTSFSCANPYRIAFDQGGKLWVIHRDPKAPDSTLAPATVEQYDDAGHSTGKIITDVDGATALAVTPDGLLLVAGPHHQVLKYNIGGATPVLAGAIGVKDGIYAETPGLMGPGRLMWLNGVGCDSQGNIYTLGRLPDTQTGIDLRAFSPDGKQLWELHSIGFTDCPFPDPESDGLDVYSSSSHFVIDPSKPPGQQAVWKGYTLDPSYDDGRFNDHASHSGFNWDAPIVRHLDGRLYLFERPGPYFGIFRKGPGEVFVPSGLISLADSWLMRATTGGHEHDLDWPPQQPMVPAPPPPPGRTPPADNPAPPVAAPTTPAAPVLVKTRWMWRDANGDGKIQPEEIQSLPEMVDAFQGITDTWVDKKGDIWMVGARTKIFHLPLQGFDDHQNPIYDLSKMVVSPAPAEFTNVNRIIYDSDAHRMYLSGDTVTNPKPAHWGFMGREVICYEKWVGDTAGTLKWRLVAPTLDPLPHDTDTGFPAFTVAGDKVYLLQRFWNRVWVFNAETAAFEGLVTTTPETGTSGWCDMSHGVTAYQRKDGSSFVFTEDDYRPKYRFYIIPPQDTGTPTLPDVGKP